MPRLNRDKDTRPPSPTRTAACLPCYVRENVDTLVREYHSGIGEDRERLRIEIPSMKIDISEIDIRRKTLIRFMMKSLLFEEIRSKGYFLKNDNCR